MRQVLALELGEQSAHFAVALDERRANLDALHALALERLFQVADADAGVLEVLLALLQVLAQRGDLVRVLALHHRERRAQTLRLAHGTEHVRLARGELGERRVKLHLGVNLASLGGAPRVARRVLRRVHLGVARVLHLLDGRVVRRESRQDGLLLLLRLLALDGKLGLELGAILGGLRVRQLEVSAVFEGELVQARLEGHRLRLALGYFIVQTRHLRVARLDVPLQHVDAPLELLRDPRVHFQTLSRFFGFGVGVVARAPRRLGFRRQRRASRFELRRLSYLRLQRFTVLSFRVQRLL